MILFRYPEDEAYYCEVEDFAKKTNQLKQFYKQAWILHTFRDCDNPRFAKLQDASLNPIKCSGTILSRAWLYRDFAPYSFNVTLERRIEKESAHGFDQYEPWMSLGLIYHGSHDGYGSGSAPTFAVTIEPVQGWSIHS